MSEGDSTAHKQEQEANEEKRKGSGHLRPYIPSTSIELPRTKLVQLRLKGSKSISGSVWVNDPGTDEGQCDPRQQDHHSTPQRSRPRGVGIEFLRARLGLH